MVNCGKHGPHDTKPRKIWRVDARDDVTDSDKPADSGSNNSGPVKGARKRRALIIGAYVAAAAAFTAAGFGATSVIRDQHGGASAASAIPTPPPANQTFVEDDDGTGADSQENILQSTVPGLAQITSAHGSGSAIVLTRSGLLLTSSQVASGGGAITVRVLPSGHAYRAKVTGSDPAHGLALLQIQGGSSFTPVAVGNSADFAVGAAATSVSANASGKAFTLAVGDVSSTGAAATISGRRITGLMTTSAQVFAGRSAGGPVVNLSGQVVGIDLSGSAHGADVTSYAVPVNEALLVAQRLKH
jgi:S1-C subfamily serine protease